jgi:hypothetical protein
MTMVDGTSTFYTKPKRKERKREITRGGKKREVNKNDSGQFKLRSGPEPPQRPHPHSTYHIRYHAYEDHDRKHQIRANFRKSNIHVYSSNWSKRDMSSCIMLHVLHPTKTVTGNVKEMMVFIIQTKKEGDTMCVVYSSMR